MATKEGLEIERKFLLKKEPKAHVHGELGIHQCYVHDGDDKFRIRSTRDRFADTTSCDKTYKERLSVGVYTEKVIDITEEQFEAHLKKAHRSIKKDRIIMPHTHDGLKWEIDVFQSPIRLIVAEIEMPVEGYDLILPDFIQEVLIMEVTHLKEFTNYSLATPIVR